MRILIVDEIGSYTDELVKFFRDKGHFVTPIESADEDSPLQILRTRRNEKVDILIFHTGRMPQAQSLTFCSFARQLWPEIFIRVDGIGSIYKSVADIVGPHPESSELEEILESVASKSAGR